MSYLNKTKCELQISTARHVRIFLFSRKVILLKVVHPLKIYKHIKLHGPTLNGANFSTT
jgi:hypothetical protein